MGLSGLEVVPEKKIHLKSFFNELKSHVKFHNPRITPSWRKVCDPNKKEEEKIIPKIVDTMFRGDQRIESQTSIQKIWKKYQISLRKSF